MLKHILEAIKQSGIDPKEITVDTSSRSHVTIVVRGKKITASSSPKNATIATRNIARDIRNCLTNV